MSNGLELFTEQDLIQELVNRHNHSRLPLMILSQRHVDKQDEGDTSVVFVGNQRNLDDAMNALLNQYAMARRGEG